MPREARQGPGQGRPNQLIFLPNLADWRRLPEGRSGRLLYSRRRFRRHPSYSVDPGVSARSLPRRRRPPCRPAASRFRCNCRGKSGAARRRRGRVSMPITRRRAVPIVAAAWRRRCRRRRRRSAAPQVAGQHDVRPLTRAYNASGQALFRRFRRRPRQYRVLPVFDRHRDGDGAGRRARRDRARDGRGAPAQPRPRADQRRQCGGDRGAQRLRQERQRRRPVRPACGSRASAARPSPTATGNCPFPANRSGEICVATPRFPPSAKLLVANALMLGAADVAKDYAALLKDRYAAEVFRGASLDTVNGWVKQRTEGKIEQHPRKDVRRGAGQRGLFQVALGASRSTRSSPGTSSSA